jgi:PAS domain S-box-containing protein
MQENQGALASRGAFEKLRQQVVEGLSSIDGKAETALIEELQQLVSQLYKRQERFHRLVESSPDALFVHDGNEIRYANPAAFKLFRANGAEQIVGLSPLDLVPSQQQSQVRQRIRRVLEEGFYDWVIEQQVRRLDGSLGMVEMTVAPIPWDGVPAIQVHMREISARKRMEAELQQAQQALDRRLKRERAKLELTTATLVEESSVRQQAQQQAMARARELSTLNSFASAVSSSLELPQVLHTLEMLLSQQLEIPGGAVFFYHEIEDRVEMQTSWGLPPALAFEFTSRPVSGSHFERTIREHVVLHWSNFRQIPLFRQMELDVIRPDWVNHLCVPLVANGRVEGVLDLFNPATSEFEEEQVDFYTTLGQQTGIAIQNARLFEQVRVGREHLRQLTHEAVMAQEEERARVSRELRDFGRVEPRSGPEFRARIRPREVGRFDEFLPRTVPVPTRILQRVGAIDRERVKAHA